ncbi:PEP-CTERM sorting domain-containing protein [Verrucomicrobium spinosum]|uniref:PEP-CTERM sorting domain-containing protein n=1 Tax=Verrucomicrobium spinosum TaxID=2736 RepID=UPI0018DB5E58|nr:PEP-CTERM sorting domain-containing protein [Verrucomicrobium spinosum]
MNSTLRQVPRHQAPLGTPASGRRLPAPRFLSGALAVFCLGADLSAAVTLSVSSTYDENTRAANTIDGEAPGNSIALGTFKTAVGAAHAAGTGGVINFDMPNGSNADAKGNSDTNNSGSKTLISVGYGGTKSFAINTSLAYDMHVFTSLAAVSGNSGASGTSKGIAIASGMPDNSAVASSWTLNFGEITGGLPGEAITSMGFVLLSRDFAGTTGDLPVTVEWFLNGGTTASYSVTDQVKDEKWVDGVTTGDDTFFSYSAPVGSYISGFKMTYGGTIDTDRRLGIDDIGFTTSVVPEPSRALLVAVAMTGLMLRRRRWICPAPHAAEATSFTLVFTPS